MASKLRKMKRPEEKMQDESMAEDFLAALGEDEGDEGDDEDLDPGPPPVFQAEGEDETMPESGDEGESPDTLVEKLEKMGFDVSSLRDQMEPEEEMEMDGDEEDEEEYA